MQNARVNKESIFHKEGILYLPFFHILIILVFLLPIEQECRAATYKVTGNLIGEATNYKVDTEDTLYSIARKFDVGLIDLMAANPGVDPWIPGEQTTISIPTSYLIPNIARSGIIVNLSELRLYYFPDAKTVMTFPVGIGREGWQTPIGKTTIILKRKNPVWIPPPSILAVQPELPKIVAAGPDNPLGEYALNLGWESFAIHGTDKPYGIGLRSSHGCIRMYPEDIKVLFDQVKKGTKVTVIDEPYKIIWVGDKLYIEASPTEAQSANIINNENHEVSTPAQIYKTIEKMAGDKIKINWQLVDEILVKRNGIPTDITMGEE